MMLFRGNLMSQLLIEILQAMLSQCFSSRCGTLKADCAGGRGDRELRLDVGLVGLSVLQ